MSEKVKAYKGFNVIAAYNEETETFDEAIECRGFRFEEGKTYEEPEASLCRCGFHACTYPLDVFNYYKRYEDGIIYTEYHVVDLEDISSEQSEDSKICAKKITIGRRITPDEMIEISKTFPAEPIEGMNNENLTSCFFIKDDVTKAEPIIRNAAMFFFSKDVLISISDNYDKFSYFRLSDGMFESNCKHVNLSNLENYSFWKGIPTQERLDEYYERKKHARKN